MIKVTCSTWKLTNMFSKSSVEYISSFSQTLHFLHIFVFYINFITYIKSYSKRNNSVVYSVILFFFGFNKSLDDCVWLRFILTRLCFFFCTIRILMMLYNLLLSKHWCLCLIRVLFHVFFQTKPLMAVFGLGAFLSVTYPVFCLLTSPDIK